MVLSTREHAESLVARVAHWHQDFEVFPGLWTGGTYKPQFWWEWMALPERLDGLRVIDIGSSDGYFSLELARRGAYVLAVDYQPRSQTGFWVMEELYGHPFEFHQANIFDLDPTRLGTFDIVLCLGVLYHLPDPYRALAVLANLCKPKGQMFLETVSAVGIDPSIPLMRFYRGRTLVGDITNFWTQNALCLRQMIEDVGFRVTREFANASDNGEWSRIVMQGEREENAEAEFRKQRAYGYWADERLAAPARTVGGRPLG